MPESATQGNPALASAAGTVVTSEFHPNGGNVVQIRHAGGWYTTYIHLDTRPVIVGQYVPRVYRIGTIGHTGAMSNGVPHLHYEQAHDDNGDGFVNWGTPTSERKPVVWNGVTVDPAPAGKDGFATSANCGTPDQVGMFRGSNPPTMFLDNDHDGSSDIKIYWGGDGDQPLSGDWDGNGSHGVGLYRAKEGRFHLDQDNDGLTDNWVSYGDARDRPVTGDWDGSGGDGIGLWRPSDHTFRLDNWVDGTFDYRFSFGKAGDYPFAGDFDGDGKDGVGLFRPDNGRVYLDNNLDGVADQEFPFGTAGDRPFSRKRG